MTFQIGDQVRIKNAHITNELVRNRIGTIIELTDSHVKVEFPEGMVSIFPIQFLTMMEHA